MIDSDSPLTASCQLSIPFNDLDPAGVVWHGRYLKYFECARARLMDELGYGYPEMQDSGLLWPVVDLNVSYRKPLRLNEKIVVAATLREWEFRLTVDHEITNESGERCVTATTVQVPVFLETMEICLGAPQRLMDSIERKLHPGSNGTG